MTLGLINDVGEDLINLLVQRLTNYGTYEQPGKPCSPEELAAARGECLDGDDECSVGSIGNYDEWSRCHFIAWFAPLGFPLNYGQELTAFGGAAQAIGSLPAGSFAGFKGAFVQGPDVQAIQMSMHVGTAGFEFATQLSLFDLFRGAFTFSCSRFLGSMQVSGAIVLDFNALKMRMKEVMRSAMGLDKQLSAMRKVMRGGNMDLCKLVGSATSVCDMGLVPDTNVVRGILSGAIDTLKHCII